MTTTHRTFRWSSVDADITKS